MYWSRMFCMQLLYLYELSEDPALTRPGRIDRMVYVGMPRKEERFEVLKIQSKKMPFHEDVDLELLSSSLTSNYSSAEIVALCQQAGILALETDISATHVYTCIYVYIYVCMHVLKYMFICIFISIRTFVYVRMCDRY